MSLVTRHRERMLAIAASEQAAAAGEGVAINGPAATEYEMIKARLGVDLRRLKEIQSIERKVELKRELAPAYGPWVRGVLEADTGADDVIVTHMMIWAIDCGEYQDGLELADYMLRHKLALPERFKSTTGTFIVESIADAAIAVLSAANVDEAKLAPYRDGTVLTRIDSVAAVEDMPDQVRAKNEKAQGLALELAAAAIEPDADGPAGGKRALIELTLRRYRRALELDNTVGVKSRIQSLEREIVKLGQPEQS
jgi:hypothetical protein